MNGIQSKREANKAQKKAAFLGAAETLFIKKGFENTSMDEVVKGSGLTKKTLYQYFQSKEDLYYAVVLKGALMLYEATKDAMACGENAREKIRLANLAHMNFYREHLNLFQMLNYTPANRENSEASLHYQEIKVLDAGRMGYIVSLMAAGVSDGSINARLDMKMAILFGFFSAFSMLYTFAYTDKGMWKALQIDEDDFIRFSFDLLSDALK
jgi:AcrR family transcriptional regulator